MHKKLFKERKNGIEILVGQAVFKFYQNSQNVGFIWINNSRTAWPTLILMLFWVPWTIYYMMYKLFFKKSIILR